MKLEVFTKNDNQEIQNFIISKIREHINNKNLEPGEKLPSERVLSEKLEVSRNNVREAIQKLEFYGLLKSIPQSGTFVANIGIVALNGMVDDILALKEPDFQTKIETRILLELETVRLAALRRTSKDLKRLKKALKAHETRVINGEDSAQEDLLFHLAITKASHNSILETFMLIITPEIIINFENQYGYEEVQKISAINVHKEVYKAIKNQDSVLAKEIMNKHFFNLYKNCYRTKEEIN